MSNKLLKKHYNGHCLYRVIPDPLYLTLQTDGHGIISADALSGYSGDTITLSNTAHDGYGFSGYTVTGASLNGSTLTMNNEDATAKAWFSAKPVSSLKLSAQDLRFSSYSSYPDHSKPSTEPWPIFYYNKNIDCGTFTRNSVYTYFVYEGSISNITAVSYSIADADMNYPIKYVIDRNNRNFSAYRNSDFLGNGTLSVNANINHIDNFVFTADNYLNYRIMSATNIRLAGFDQWTAATAYNG